MNIRDYQLILWDFNGTILDDLKLGMDTVNILLRRRGLPTIDTVERYHSLFGFPVQDYYERIGLWTRGEDFSPVAYEWLNEYRKEEHTAPLRSGILPLFDSIQKTGIPMGILSATETGMLKEQVKNLAIDGYFTCLLGRGDIYAGDKSQIAATYRGAHPHDRILMIGDTTHDYETATAGGFDCILVEGGHESRENLLKNGVPVAKDPLEIGRLLDL